MGAAGEREREHGREELRGEGRLQRDGVPGGAGGPGDINNRTLKKTQNATKHLKSTLKQKQKGYWGFWVWVLLPAAGCCQLPVYCTGVCVFFLFF